MKLERIVVGARVSGLEGESPVEIIAFRAYGRNALEVTWKGPNGFGNRVLYREDEDRIRAASPNRRFAFDSDARSFRLAAEALRIRLAHLFDPYLAVYSSQIEPLPHQLTAVYEEMLKRQPLRYLLADDPGSGKTVMAGLLIKELLIRGSLERCLIVAPGNLVEQWQDELVEKFDLRFDVLSRGHVAAVQSGNPFAENSLLIARLDMLARNEELKEKFEAAPEWDLIVCDEAHRMSAHFFGHKIKYTKRFQVGELASRKTRHFLLMTATPHNGKEEDFQLFMSLLDADRFEGRYREGAHRIELSDMMRRLVKEELFRFDGTPLFPERRAYTASYQLSAGEMELYEAVTHYVREEMNRADQLDEGGSRWRNNVGFALQILQRRLASSPAAIHESLKRRMTRLELRLDEEAQKGILRGFRLNSSVQSAMEFDEDDLEEATGEEIELHENQLVDRATAARTIEELKLEIAELQRLERMARNLRHSGADTKWQELDRILDSNLVHDRFQGVTRKIVIFTEARDTLEYLAERILARTGIDENVVVIHGGVSRQQRRLAIAKFNDDPTVRFMLANDAAGEGVNLQRGAHLMVNYDLPWNPNRLEQRFGRIHRIGQTEVCHVWNLVASQTREGAVYRRLLEKLETARATLGGKVYDVLGDLFEARPLRELFIEAIRYGERAEVRERLFEAIDGAVDVRHITQLVRRNKLTHEGIDPGLVRNVREELARVSARRLWPHHICSFFKAGIEDANGAIYRREKGRFELTRVPTGVLNQKRPGGRDEPILNRYQRICFEKQFTEGQPQAELIALGHPLLVVLLDLMLERHRDTLVRGTVLIDEADRFNEPQVLVMLSHGICDGKTTKHGKPQLISERLQFVWLDQHGEAVDGGIAPYLDCPGVEEEEKKKIASVTDMPWLGGPLEDRALTFAINVLVPSHLREVRNLRLNELRKIEDAVRERLRREIQHLQRHGLELKTKELAGGRPRLNSENAFRQAEVLTERLQLRLKDFELRRRISALPPAILGAALVVPAKLMRQERDDSVSHLGKTTDALVRAEVERLAMQAVMTRETGLGHIPTDVSEEKRGYDIESRDKSTGRLRFIEVKGRTVDARTLSITRNEMLTALNAAEAFILAVVLVEGKSTRPPLYVRNPAPILGSEPNFNEVSRQISIKALESAAQQAANGHREGTR